MALLAVSLMTAGLIFVGGCSTTEAPNDTETSEISGSLDEPVAREETAGDSDMELAAFKNEDGDLACPVMGSVIISEDDAVGYQDHDGTRYYFCCGGCPEEFAADPAKYASN